MRSLLTCLSLVVVAAACGEVTNKSETDAGGNTIDANGSAGIDSGSTIDASATADAGASSDANGTCSADTDNDDDHCGQCNNPCTTDRVCVEGMCELTTDAAKVTATAMWPVVTGWETETNAAIQMDFASIPSSRVVYECRTGPISMVSSMSWAACDGSTGSVPVHRPSPAAGMEEGTYRTQARVTIGTRVGPIFTYDFYIHRSLDRAPRCVQTHTDDLAFTRAAAALDTTQTFAAGVDTRSPFIELSFQNVRYLTGMIDGWSSKPSSQTASILSLRRRFTLNSDRTLLLIRRRYESRMWRRDFNLHTCTSGYRFGVGDSRSTGPGRTKVSCEFLVLNAKGAAACLVPNPSNPTGLVVRLTSALGWLKIKRHGAFSYKGTSACPSCPSWYLELPD